jgi:hypothetical protein
MLLYANRCGRETISFKPGKATLTSLDYLLKKNETNCLTLFPTRRGLNKSSRSAVGLVRKVSSTLFTEHFTYTHPTVAAAQNFVRAPDEIDLGLRLAPDFNLDSDLLFWTAVTMVWAGQIFNTILAQPILSNELQLAARELGVVPIDELATSPHFGAMDVSEDRMNQIMFGTSARSDG